MDASAHASSRHQQPAIRPSSSLIAPPTPPAEACCTSPPYSCDDGWSTANMLSPPNSSNSSSCCPPSSSSACPPAPFSSSCCSPRLTPSVSDSTCNTPGPSSPTPSDDQVPTALIQGMSLAEIECCIIESVIKEGMNSTCCQDLIPPGTVLSQFSGYGHTRSCSTTPLSGRDKSNTSACSTSIDTRHFGGRSEDTSTSNSPFSPAPTAPTATAPATSAAAAAKASAEATATAAVMDEAAAAAAGSAKVASGQVVAMATSGTRPMSASENSCLAASTGHDARNPSRLRSSGCEPPSPFQAQQGVRCSPTSPPCSSSSTSKAFDSAVLMDRPANANIGPDPAVTMGCAAIAGMSSSASSQPISHPVSARSHPVLQPLYLNNPSSARDPLQDRPSSNHHHSRSSVSSSFLPLSPDSSSMDEGHMLVRCQWYGCSAEFVSPAELWSHLSELHVSLQEICFPTLCQWESCLAQQPNHDDLLWHLRMEHHIIPPTTPSWSQMIPTNTPHSPQSIQHQHLHGHPHPQQTPTPRSFQYPPYQEQQQKQQQQQQHLQRHHYHHLEQQHPVVMSQHRHSYSSVSSTTGSVSGSILTAEMPHMSLSGLSSPTGILGDAHHERAAWGTSSPETSPFVTIKQEEESHSLLLPQHHLQQQQQQQHPQHQHQQQQHYFSQHSSALTPMQEQLLQQSHHHPCLWGDCRLAFPSFDTLTSHLSDEHIGMGKSEYVCEWINCDRRGRGFGQRQKAMRHIQTHTGDKPFQCQVCQKRFSEANIMAQHMRTHTGEKPFRCDEPGCGRQFSISGALTIHRRVHTGEKPFKCKFQGCDKWFAESSNLTKHLRVHTGERPFQCPFVGCDKRFSRPDQVTRHKKTHMTDAEKLAVLKAEKVAELRRRR